MVSTQASGAQLHPLYTAVLQKPDFVHVGEPPGVGGPFGVANVMTKLAVFATNLAFGHESTSLTP